MFEMRFLIITFVTIMDYTFITNALLSTAKNQLKFVNAQLEAFVNINENYFDKIKRKTWINRTIMYLPNINCVRNTSRSTNQNFNPQKPSYLYYSIPNKNNLKFYATVHYNNYNMATNSALADCAGILYFIAILVLIIFNIILGCYFCGDKPNKKYTLDSSIYREPNLLTANQQNEHRCPGPDTPPITQVQPTRMSVSVIMPVTFSNSDGSINVNNPPIAVKMKDDMPPPYSEVSIPPPSYEEAMSREIA